MTTSRARWLRATIAVLMVAVVAIGVDLRRAPVVSAQDGATLSTEIAFRVDADDGGAVNVEATYKMTNVRPNRDLGGGDFEYYFFTGMLAPLIKSAVDVDVQINGRDGDFSIETDDDDFQYLDINFGYELRYGKTATVVTTYTLAGDPPRSESSFVRVNPAYVSFPVFAWGDPGRVDLQVEIPEEWDVDYVGNDLEEVLYGDTLVYRALEIDDPDNWFAFFTARDDDRLDHTTFAVGDREFDIASWPGDELWLDFATEHIAEGIPVLEGLIGAEWPVRGLTEVTEASTSYLEGYGGFYDSVLDSIEIGEELDEQVMIHELAHAWFNSSTINDRWLQEGLAEEVSARAIERLGDELPEPRTNAEIRDDWNEVETFPLLDWPPPFADADDSVEDYGYAASHRVIRAIWDELGDERMQQLLTAVTEQDRAYPAESDEPLYLAGIGWREFLDLAEQVSGSEAIQDLYGDLVLDASARNLLRSRNEVVDAYDELVDHGGTWAAPAWVRTAMARWLIDSAEERIAAADDALDLRDALHSMIAELDLTMIPGLEERYETATIGLDEFREAIEEAITKAEEVIELSDTLDNTLAGLDLTATTGIEDPYEDEESVLDDLAAEYERLITAADELTTARSRLTEHLDELGLDVPPVTQDEYDSSPYALVEDTDDLVAAASAIAEASGGLRKLLDESGLSVPALATSAFVDDPDAALELLADQQSATEAVIDAREARDSATSFVERIGLFGSDVDADLGTVVDELEAGDLAEVQRRSDTIMSDVEDLAGTGQQRLAITAGALVLLVIGTIIWRRRRRTTAAGDEPENAEAPAETVDNGVSV